MGGHLARHALARGHEVVVLDDLSSGRRSAVPAGAQFVRGDVRNAAVVERLSAGCHAIVHLAAVVGPRRVAEAPIETWSCHVEGSAVVVREAARRGCRLLYISTSEVYGSRQAHADVLRESDACPVDASSRRDVYAISKLAGEALAMAEYRSRLLPVTIVRPFNLVGPGQCDRYGMVLARFARAAASGVDLQVYGDGTQRRCFLHVSDAVDALYRLLRCDAALGEIVNLGSDEEIAISELAERVRAQCGHIDGQRVSGIAYVPFERVHGEGFVDPWRRRPCLAKLRGLLPAWQPTHTLRDAIQDALEASPTASS